MLWGPVGGRRHLDDPPSLATDRSYHSDREHRYSNVVDMEFRPLLELRPAPEQLTSIRGPNGPYADRRSPRTAEPGSIVVA